MLVHLRMTAIHNSAAYDVRSTAWYASSMSDVTIGRQEIASRGRRFEYFTIAWNTLEGLIGIGAGLLAGSISLAGFGPDSLSRSHRVSRCFGECR